MEHSTRTLVHINDIISAYRLTEAELTQLEGFIQDHSDLLIEYEENKFDVDLISKAVMVVRRQMQG